MANDGVEAHGGGLRAGVTDTVFAPAHELAGAIQRGEISSVEVVDAYLDQIARHNRTLNAKYRDAPTVVLNRRKLWVKGWLQWVAM